MAERLYLATKSYCLNSLNFQFSALSRSPVLPVRKKNHCGKMKVLSNLCYAGCLLLFHAIHLIASICLLLNYIKCSSPFYHLSAKLPLIYYDLNTHTKSVKEYANFLIWVTSILLGRFVFMNALIISLVRLCLVRMQPFSTEASNSCHYATSFPGTRLTSGLSIFMYEKWFLLIMLSWNHTSNKARAVILCQLHSDH